ncbi:hypothetical protein [Ideonella sp. YS5]|uniref:hypothetical protein n=1 Tax=Ideonella sp. YS5 TaxID=3453714 RepID=UPI003EF045BB
MTSITIKTEKASQYIELHSDTDIPTQEVGHDFLATGFHEVRLFHGETSIRWRFDRRTPGPAGLPEDFPPEATARGDLPASRHLSGVGWFELKFHVSSPLSPRQRGIWVLLLLKIDEHGDMVLSGTGLRRCGYLVADSGGLVRSKPGWFTDVDDRWVYEFGKEPSRDNGLLSATEAAPGGKDNLIDIPTTLNGRTSNDYSFAFVLDTSVSPAEVCTQFLASPTFVRSAAVSGYALRLDLGNRARAAMGAMGMALRCTQADRRDGWSLEWSDLFGQADAQRPDAFTLESLSQALLETHALGLATVRSRSRLSLIPTWLRTSGRVLLDFALRADTDQQLVDTRLVGIRLVQAGQPVELHCGGALDIDGCPMVLSARAQDVRDKGNLLLSWDLEPAGAVSCELGVDAVLMSIAGFQHGSFSFGLTHEGDPFRRSPLSSDLVLDFDAAHYRPLSVDPELGFETMAAFVQRERPWTVDLGERQPVLLLAEEHANEKRSRQLRFAVRLKEEDVRRTDVVVIDRSPLTVARVETSEHQFGDELLAEYIDDADQAPEWRFASNKGQMTATLPPQGIGEEMVKGYLHLERDGVRTRVPRDRELFDFRLTPPARLEVDRTDVDMARSEAPWSVRRLLGRRLGATGVQLMSADFELLYGMSARLVSPGLRLAELDGFIGRAPLADELQRLCARQTVGQGQPNASKTKEDYANSAAAWLSWLWHRPSWWRAYRDIGSRGRLAIDQGVTYRLRPSRDTANPFSIGDPAPLTTPGALFGPREPLRGGVDWPFQSLNVYGEMIGKPQSSAGSVEGLVFGSLGGEGGQTAAFNNGKTLIITTSRQGRLDSLTLIRVGRIAMLWNKARHVIVYERTTRRAPRYDETDSDDLQDSFEGQPPFPGLAALRKVREYVEITEPRRRYPDSSAAASMTGPLLQSVFATVAIPVRSDWGRDIRDGFVIALRGPIPPGKEAFFPDPQVFLDLARAPGKGGGSIGQRILSTERLVFFTSTRDLDGGDSDAWPAWPDVDYPLLPPPAPPPLPFTSSFSSRDRQPDACAIEPGMAHFTLVLNPAEEAVNLMHGRDVPGLEARLSNINLARGLPAGDPPLKAEPDPSSPEGQSLKGLREATAPFCAAHGQLLDGLAELRAALRERVAAGDDTPLKAQPDLQREVGELLDRLHGAASQVKVDAAPQVAWDGKQADRLVQYQNAVARQAKDLAGQFSQLPRQLEGLGVEAARQRAKALADGLLEQAVNRVGEVGFLPLQALAALRQLVATLEGHFTARLVQWAAEFRSSLGRLEAAYANDPDAATELDAQWQEDIGTLPAKLRVLLDVLDQYADAALREFFSRLPMAEGGETLYAPLRAVVDTGIGAAADWVARWNDSLPPFDEEAPDFQRMRDELTRILDKGLVETLLKGVREQLQSMLDEINPWWESAGQAAAQHVLDTLNDLMPTLDAPGSIVADFQKALADAAGQVETAMSGAAAGLATAIKDKLPTFKATLLQGSLDALKDFHIKATAPLDAIRQALAVADGTIGDLEHAVRAQATVVEQYAQAGATQLEDWARQAVGSVVAIANENADAALQTLRVLADGPVTEALKVSRDQLGYYYGQGQLALQLTRSSAIFNDLGAQALNSLSSQLPFDRIRDRLLPRLDGLAVRDLFPDFCGLKLTYLLPDLDVPLDGTQEFGLGAGAPRLRQGAPARVGAGVDQQALRIRRHALRPGSGQAAPAQAAFHRRQQHQPDRQRTRAAHHGLARGGVRACAQR